MLTNEGLMPLHAAALLPCSASSSLCHSMLLHRSRMLVTSKLHSLHTLLSSSINPAPLCIAAQVFVDALSRLPAPQV